MMDFFQPVRYIESDHPIYGMQSRGIDGVDEPLERIEDMAQFYLDAVQGIATPRSIRLMGTRLAAWSRWKWLNVCPRRGENRAPRHAGCIPHMRYLSFGQRMRLAAGKRDVDFHILANSVEARLTTSGWGYR